MTIVMRRFQRDVGNVIIAMCNAMPVPNLPNFIVMHPSVCTHSDYPTRIGRFGTGIALQLSHRDYHIANIALKTSHHDCHIPTDASHIAIIAQRIAHGDGRVNIVA